MGIIAFFVGLVVGGVVGLLVGRKNKNGVEAAYQAAQAELAALKAKAGIK